MGCKRLHHCVQESKKKGTNDATVCSFPHQICIEQGETRENGHLPCGRAVTDVWGRVSDAPRQWAVGGHKTK